MMLASLAGARPDATAPGGRRPVFKATDRGKASPLPPNGGLPLIGIKPRVKHFRATLSRSESKAQRPPRDQLLNLALCGCHLRQLVRHTYNLQDLGTGGSKLGDLNCLGLQGAGSERWAHGSAPSLGLRELPFQKNPELIGCTSGPVADRLAWRLALGAPTLHSALAHWLIPRHAAQLQRAVEDGRIILWVQLFDNDDERRALSESAGAQLQFRRCS